jgi:hypothetical protein
MSTAYQESLDAPHVVIRRLAEIERDLADRQGLYEETTRQWFEAQREIKKAHAEQMLRSSATSVTEKRADADLKALLAPGAEQEALYEALRAVIRVLEQRSIILMSLLRAQSQLS